MHRARTALLKRRSSWSKRLTPVSWLFTDAWLCFLTVNKPLLALSVEETPM